MLRTLIEKAITSQTLTPEMEQAINTVMWQEELNENDEKLLKQFLVDLECGIIRYATWPSSL